jgi:chloramphenicol 3-O-phosphotransferase
MAAGKSSVAEALAQRLDRSVHVRGDLYRRMIVNGRVDMSARPDPEALRQLRLRYRVAASTVRLYHDAGFAVVFQDVIIGPILEEVVALYTDLPLLIVVLCPRPDVIAERERARVKSGYGGVSIEQLQDVLADTPRLGLWIDNSDQTLAQTTDAILRARGEFAAIRE